MVIERFDAIVKELSTGGNRCRLLTACTLGGRGATGSRALGGSSIQQGDIAKRTWKRVRSDPDPPALSNPLGLRCYCSAESSGTTLMAR